MIQDQELMFELPSQCFDDSANEMAKQQLESSAAIRRMLIALMDVELM